MRKIQQFLMIMAVASLAIFISCGKDDDGGQTEKELVIEALTSGNWTIDESGSSAGNGVDASAVSISFSAGSDVSFTLSGGDIASYVSGGTLTVSESGGITVSDLTVVSADLEVNAANATGVLSNAKATFTLSFQAEEAASRVSGFGSYTLVFVKAS